jgi:hypothetical protein
VPATIKSILFISYVRHVVVPDIRNYIRFERNVPNCRAMGRYTTFILRTHITALYVHDSVAKPPLSNDTHYVIRDWRKFRRDVRKDSEYILKILSTKMRGRKEGT